MKRIVISILLVALISDTKISYSMNGGDTSGTEGVTGSGGAGAPSDGVPVAVQTGSEDRDIGFTRGSAYKTTETGNTSTEIEDD